MPIYELSDKIAFPNPELASDEGILAIGGDMSVERVMLAYEHGIFPWYNRDQPILWWSPPQRMMLYPNQFRVSKSLKKSIAKEDFELKIDTAFNEVMQQCRRAKRKGENETWINDSTIAVFDKLHQMGFAHSFEIWQQNTLVGGLYGLSMGRAFFGESMFTSVADASKVAFYHLHEFMLNQDFHFIDCQIYNEHLASLGASEISRKQFLQELRAALAYPDLKGKWINYL